jgi:hypothetical protein
MREGKGTLATGPAAMMLPTRAPFLLVLGTAPDAAGARAGLAQWWRRRAAPA